MTIKHNCKYIVVHCSDSPNSLSDSRIDTAGDVHRWHKEKGWDGIGYHYFIDEKGREQFGRPVFESTKDFWHGAHVLGHNHESIGICLAGKNEFNLIQLKKLSERIKRLLEVFDGAKVVGHRDLDSRKTCPNFDLGVFCAEWGLINEN